MESVKADRASMKRPRPYIPLSVRVQVAERQFWNLTKCIVTWRNGKMPEESPSAYLARCLIDIAERLGCTADQLELHHRPALINRQFNQRTGKYTPDANDVDCLVYLEKSDHRIETHVRGINGQFSDMMLRQRERRRKRKARRKFKAKIPSRKNPWPKRSFPKKRPPVS